MRTLRTIFAVVALGASTNALMAGFAQAQTCACPVVTEESGATRVRIIADEAPPPLPEYEQPALPAPGYIWTPGYWAWNNDDYYWVPGTWVEPPHPGLLWTPGYWAFVDGVYAFHRGYWGPHVGFYGGVSYGFGYYGAGFEGGRWDGDRFFYNRSVNNFGAVRIVNVFERPAPRIEARVSFNGGPEGVKAAPTAEELAAAKEPHVQRTAAQRRNASAASHNESAFVSANKGKPPVAATSKAGVFKGAAVAPATAAGGPLKLRKTEEPANAETLKPTPGASPESKTETPKAEKAEPKGEKHKAEKAGLKTDTTTGEKVEPKVETPTGEKVEPKAEKHKADKHKADKADRPTGEKVEPMVETPKAEKAEPKAEKHKADMHKTDKVEPREEKPKVEKERPRNEPKVDKPKAEAEHPKAAARSEHPQAHRAEEAHPACHPGAPNCPK